MRKYSVYELCMTALRTVLLGSSEISSHDWRCC